MLNNFLQVGSQVIVLFLLMGVGFVATKLGFFTKDMTSKLTDFVLYFVAPAIVIVSFQLEFDKELLIGLGVTAFLAVVAHIINILLAKILIHDTDKARESVLRFGSIFSNCGFMGLPLDFALFGSGGVFYGAAYIAVFNIVSWSYGVVLMNKGRSDYRLSWKKVFINPGTIGVVIALVLFLCSIELPKPIYETINYVGSLNTPVPMFIIGSGMVGMSLKELFKERSIYPAVLLRLVIVPLILIAILYIFKVNPIIAGVCLVGVSAPSAALTSMFAVKFDRDEASSINIVSLSTLVSIVTMPFLIALLQTLMF